jgi:predicted DNA-binding transcriptional regulator AlpA
MQDKVFLSLSELSQKYGIPLSTLRRWAAERRFPIFKISNRIRVSITEWEDWLRQFHTKGGK